MSATNPGPASSVARDPIRQRYRTVRGHSMHLIAGLSAEDQCIQSMPDASPAKWHVAHTTWFFETVLLKRLQPGYVPLDPRFNYLFNSYYEALGPRQPRPRRGMVTRPSVEEVAAYRAHVDAAVETLMDTADEAIWPDLHATMELGLHHEQQHQELLLTDILHAFSCNPLLPAYRAASPAPPVVAVPAPVRWLRHEGGLHQVGHAGPGFAFDNESPRHTVLLQPHEIADRLVTCGEYAEFIADGGYRRPELWLSDGWAAIQSEGWEAPAYWFAHEDPRLRYHDPAPGWNVFGLEGLRPMRSHVPVSQLSFYEAAAYAEWAGARLPTEFEWEAAHARPGMTGVSDQVWQWTRSSYDPYPGFHPLPGIAAEYNGKFMVSQIVLRGGSLATPAGHLRPTYRNFFPPAARWQFSGLRLAKDL